MQLGVTPWKKHELRKTWDPRAVPRTPWAMSPGLQAESGLGWQPPKGSLCSQAPPPPTPVPFTQWLVIFSKSKS